MELGLKDKVVLITGASRGIGKTIAEAFAAEGAVLVLNDILSEVLRATVEEFRAQGIRAHGYVFDITDQDAVREGVERIEREAGPISVLVNNAGLQKRYPLEEFPVEVWRQVVEVDLTGAFIVSQAVAKGMIARGAGKIISITSINAELVRETISAYCAAKGALKNLTKSMATEWGTYGINANAIGPGYIKTDIDAELASRREFDEWVKSEVPLRRWGKKEEVASVAVFLASDGASYINGQTIYVDGGWQACL